MIRRGFTESPCRLTVLISHNERPGMRPKRSSTRWIPASFAALAVLAIILFLIDNRRSVRNSLRLAEATSGSEPFLKLMSYEQGGTPSLKGGVGWINSGPITLPELRGKIVLLDFWTFCCINCHHILPDLAKLEEKYQNELVVIGVHTAKFDAERDTENIRRKVREYRIKHPVVNDANQVIWRHFGVQSWPTLVLLDANGKYLGGLSGEGHYDELDQVIGKLVEMHKAKGDLNLTPLKFSAEMERPSNGPLLFPGKVVADGKGKRLFISDTGHNRIIQTNLEGANPVVIGDGEEGFEDGAFEKSRFNRPQGMYLDGEILYVADTENHAIRAVNLGSRSVATIAGIGTQSPRMQAIPFSGPAKSTALSSPWDLIQLPGERALYIAMAGPHQIWKLDLDSLTVGVFAGSGYENILDGPPDTARFAQPSGLATDGENLFVADSEVSGIRAITGIAAKETVRAHDRGHRPLRFRRSRRTWGERPPPALPGRGLWRRPPVYRRQLQQQGQGLHSQDPIREDAGRLAQAGGDRRASPFLRTRGAQRFGDEALRRRHQQPQDPGRRPEDR